MNKFLLKKTNSYVVEYFKNEFTVILVRLLTLLNINIEFPVEMEELIFSIPKDVSWCDMCNNMYSMLYTPEANNIKENIDKLERIYNNLIDVEKKISKK